MKTVYVLGSAGVVWGWILALLALGCGTAGLLVLFRIARRPQPENTDKRFGAMLVLLMLAMFSGGWAGERYADYRVLAAAAQRSPLQISEGCVEVLREQRAEGRAPGDLIVVGATQFVLDYYGSSPGYQRTISHGGVLRAGTAVRIHHYENIIVRIDTLPLPCP